MIINQRVAQVLPPTGLDITGSVEIDEMDYAAYERVVKKIEARQAEFEEAIGRAIDWLVTNTNIEMPADEVRRQVVEMFGAEVDAELARRFGKRGAGA